jgi:hypothetical protein
MIWIIASIPFWTAGTALFIVSAGGLSNALFRAKEMDQDSFNKQMGGSFVMLVVAGVLLFLAAKTVS